MKKFLFFFALLSSIHFTALGQCTFNVVDTDDFEYNTTITGLISGTVYHLVPLSLKAAHSPTRYCYMNFVNTISANTLVFNRSYDVCANQEYKFSAWFNEINGGTSSYTLRAKDANDSTLFTSAQTNSTSSWVQWTSASFTPTTSTVQFQLVYNSGTGNNDLAMDDLVLEVCALSAVANDSITICNRSAPFNLLDSISLPYGNGGDWTGPSTLANGSMGTFNINTMMPGEYTYTLSNGGNCADSVGSIFINVNTVDTSVTVNNGVFTASASGASYQWIDCNSGQALAGETGQSFTPVSNGLYAVEITQDGCIDTSGCKAMTTVGLSENGLPGMLVSPNPTSGLLNVSLGQEYEQIEVVLINILGQTVYTHSFENSSELMLDLSTLAANVYYLQVRIKNQQRTIKVVLHE